MRSGWTAAGTSCGPCCWHACGVAVGPACQPSEAPPRRRRRRPVVLLYRQAGKRYPQMGELAAMLEEGVLEKAARGVWGASRKEGRYSK